MYKLNLREVSYALSEALDLVGIDDAHHGKRVAYMAGELSKRLSHSTDRTNNLINIGMLHDCGVSRTDTHHYLVTELDWDSSQNHCDRGALLVKNVSFYKEYSDVIYYHHTHWSVLQEKDIEDEVKVNANIILLVDRVDALRAQSKTIDEIKTILLEQKSRMFADFLVDAFLELSKPTSFWLYLETQNLELYLQDWISEDTEKDYEFKLIKEIAFMFSDIVDAKSSFTAEHSLNVSRICLYLADKFNLSKSKTEILELAALLHDLGKLRVDDRILEKKGPLNEEERHVMDRHGFDSEMILRQISGFKEIAILASSHHESLDGKGYPYNKEAAELSLEARILMVSDVFQALVQKRPYRGQLSSEKVIDILDEMNTQGKIDKNVFSVIKENLDEIYQIAVQK